MVSKKRSICAKRGYHDWSSESPHSLTEDDVEMEVQFRCKTCGSLGEGTISWDADTVSDF